MDLRDFIQILKDHGELVEVDEEVDWNYVIPAFDLMSGIVAGPAFLFNKPKGVKEGRVLEGHFAGPFRKPHRRQALAVGLDPEIDEVGYNREMLKRYATPLRPIEVATGPVKEVIKMGKEANLFDFPFTYHAIGDGGRYLFQGQVIIKDPDSDWENIGHYCTEIYSARRVAITPYAESNFRLIWHGKYEARGQVAPVAIVIGGDPACYLAATSPLPPGVSEYDIAGAIRGVPLELVRCETSDLLVPANAEMVIECEIHPYETLPEGPKPESFGYSAGPRQPFLGLRVNCITHRKNPIIMDLHQGIGGTGLSLCDASFRVGISMLCRMLGLPFKAATWYTYWGGVINAVSLKNWAYPEPYSGFRRDLEDIMMGNPVLSCMAHELVVDPDISVYDLDQLVEAMFTQTNPARDVRLTADRHPRMTLESSWHEDVDRQRYYNLGHLEGKHLFIDATTKEKPPLNVIRTRFEYLYPDDVQEWVVDNWKKWGFREEMRWYKPYMAEEQV
jgi:4-hydroxy-3-polyprenylbenzoate decarboxylase